MAAVSAEPRASIAREIRGARVVCWCLIGLATSAGTVCALLWGPTVGLPKIPGDGSLLLLAGIGIALVSIPVLLLLAPALRTVRPTAPRLWAVTLPSGLFLLAYAIFVLFQLYALSRATDL